VQSHLPAIDALWDEASEVVDDEDGQRRGLSRDAFAAVVRRLKMEILLPHQRPRAKRQSSALAAVAPAPALSRAASSMVAGMLRMTRSASMVSAAGAVPSSPDEPPAALEEIDMKAFDFTKRRMHVHDVSEARLRDFFLNGRVKDTILRWIMVEW